MKNLTLTLVLLPTEDASELFIHKGGDLCFNKVGKRDKTEFATPHHLYITSKRKIKEGEWKYCSFTNQVTKYDPNAIVPGTGTCEDCRKIEFTTDPELTKGWIRDNDPEQKNLTHIDLTTMRGVPAIPEQCLIPNLGEIDFPYAEVNFLEEFCKRYNQKDNQKGICEQDVLMVMPDNQKGVDVEITEMDFRKLIDKTNHLDTNIFKNILSERCFSLAEKMVNQALQSNAGGFSEGQVRDAMGHAYFACHKKIPVKNIADEIIQSLTKEQEVKCNCKVGHPYQNLCCPVHGEFTKEQPKGEIQMWCDMEDWIKGTETGKEVFQKIKLINGQPILTFK